MDVAVIWEQTSSPHVSSFLRVRTLRPSNIERFRANADECERRASQSRDPQLKAQFMELAADWRHLAEQVESIAHDRESALKTLRTVGK